MLDRLSSRHLIILLAVVGLLGLAHDLWEVLSGNADLNKHIPFILPAVMAAFIWIVRTVAKVGKSV